MRRRSPVLTCPRRSLTHQRKCKIGRKAPEIRRLAFPEDRAGYDVWVTDRRGGRSGHHHIHLKFPERGVKSPDFQAFQRAGDRSGVGSACQGRRSCFSRHGKKSGQGGIRTRGRGCPLRRFSKPVPSAARPPVRPVWIIPPAPRPVNFRRGGRLAPRTCPSRRWTAGEVGPGRRRTPLAYPSVTMHQNPLFLTGQRLVGGTGGLYILWTGRNDRPCQRTQRDSKRWQRRKRQDQRQPSRERSRR